MIIIYNKILYMFNFVSLEMFFFNLLVLILCVIMLVYLYLIIFVIINVKKLVYVLYFSIIIF